MSLCFKILVLELEVAMFSKVIVKIPKKLCKNNIKTECDRLLIFLEWSFNVKKVNSTKTRKMFYVLGFTNVCFCVVFCRVEPGLHLGEYLMCHVADCMLWSSHIYYQLTIWCWMFIFNRAQQWLLIFWMAPIPELNFQFIPSNVVFRKFRCIYSFKSKCSQTTIVILTT